MKDELFNRLKEFRAREDITQEVLASRVGVTRQTIISIERRVYTPSTALALRLANALDVTVEEIFRLSNETGKESKS